MDDGKRSLKHISYIHNNTDELLLGIGGSILNVPENGDLVIIKDKIYKVVKKYFAYDSIDGKIHTEIGVLVEDFKKEEK